MNKLKITAALAASILLVACEGPNKLRGNLVVNEPFKVKTVKGTLITVPVAKFGTKIELDGDGARAFIHFKNGDVAFDIPKVKEDSSGKFAVPANRLRQEFGLQGKIFHRRENIDREGTESCVSGYNSENKCDWKDVCETDNEGKESCNNQYVCENMEVPIYGSQSVNEVGYQDTKVIAIDIVKEAKAVAKFNATYAYRERISSRRATSSCY